MVKGHIVDSQVCIFHNHSVVYVGLIRNLLGMYDTFALLNVGYTRSPYF